MFRAVNRSPLSAATLRYDLHNHLLPGVDDGVQTVDEALESIQHLITFGYMGAVTTPHIYPEVFDNTETELRNEFAKLSDLARQHFPSFRLELGAEYYLHDKLLAKIVNNPGQLITFGRQRQWILIEFPRFQAPANSDQLFLACQRCALQPIIAHPERYDYIQEDKEFALLQDWADHGALLQIDLGALAGQYGPAAADTGKILLKQQRYHFIGTDLHRPQQCERYLSPAWRSLNQKKIDFNEKMHHQLICDLK